MTELTPGNRLHDLSKAFRFTLRDVHEESLRLARRLCDKRFILPASRLHELEAENRTPKIYRVYTLAHIYGFDVREVMEWYGVPRR